MADSYDVEPIKPPKDIAPSSSEEDKYPCLCIPIDPSWASDLQDMEGKEVVFEVKGKLTGVKTVTPEKSYDRNEATIDVTNVSYEGKGDYDDLMES